jgi:hypothetical protein
MRTEQEELRVLSDSSLFTDELGSVSLYKHVQKMGASKLLEGLGDAKGIREGGTLLSGLMGPVG